MSLCLREANASPLGTSSTAGLKELRPNANQRSRTPLNPNQVAELQTTVKGALEDAGKTSKVNKVKQAAAAKVKDAKDPQDPQDPKDPKDPKSKTALRKALELQVIDEKKKTKKAGLLTSNYHNVRPQCLVLKDCALKQAN